jgi:hypothetical protein
MVVYMEDGNGNDIGGGSSMELIRKKQLFEKVFILP